MARTLGLTVVAEGADHIHQLTAPRSSNSDPGQGFLTSPPLEAAHVPAFLASATAADGTPGAAVRIDLGPGS